MKVVVEGVGYADIAKIEGDASKTPTHVYLEYEIPLPNNKTACVKVHISHQDDGSLLINASRNVAVIPMFSNQIMLELR